MRSPAQTGERPLQKKTTSQEVAMISRYRTTLLAGTIAAAFALPAVAATTTYELYGEQGPAAYQVTLDSVTDMAAGKMQARSQMGEVKGEFSAFEPMPRDAGAADKLGREWGMNPAAAYPDGARITP